MLCKLGNCSNGAGRRSCSRWRFRIRGPELDPRFASHSAGGYRHASGQPSYAPRPGHSARGTATPPAGRQPRKPCRRIRALRALLRQAQLRRAPPPQIQICPDLLLPERRLRVAPHNLRRSIRAHRILQAARPAALRAELCPALQTVRPVQPRTQDRQRRIHQPREAGTLGVLAVPRPVRLQRREILVHR